MSEITYKTGWIKDSEGNKFAPITTTDQVITSDGADLASEINNIKNDVTTLNSKIIFKTAYSPDYTIPIGEGQMITLSDFYTIPDGYSLISSNWHFGGTGYNSCNYVPRGLSSYHISNTSGNVRTINAVAYLVLMKL